MKSRKGPFAVLLVLLVVLQLAFFAVTAYSALQRTVRRISLDFYFPYMEMLKKTEITVSQEMLLAKSKQELVSTLAGMYRENENLMARSALIDSLKEENRKLRDQLRMNIPNGTESIHAEIISRNPVSWNETFILDHGSLSGVEEGNLVLGVQPLPDSGGFITAVAGRVISVSQHTSVVATLYSSECKLSVTVSSSGAHGILQGNDMPEKGVAQVRYLPVKQTYSSGEQVVTSGFSEFTPRGIPVGTLTEQENGEVAVPDPSRLYAETLIRPFLNYENLRFVAILATGSTLP